MNLEQQCLNLLPPGGRFRTGEDIARELGAAPGETLLTLYRTYRDARLDRFMLIQGGTLTGYYGRHRGVRPGTARHNAAARGETA